MRTRVIWQSSFNVCQRPTLGATAETAEAAGTNRVEARVDRGLSAVHVVLGDERVNEAPRERVKSLHITLHDRSAMMVTNRDGWIVGNRAGLFDHDTRYLSLYTITFDDLTPTLTTFEQLAHNRLVLTYTNSTIRSNRVTIGESGLFMKVTRILHDGLHEQIEITSFIREVATFRLLIGFDTVFDTIFEVRGLDRRPPRMVRTSYDNRTRTASWWYRDTWFGRDLHYRIISSGSEPRHSQNLMMFPLRIDPQSTWRLETITTMGSGVEEDVDRACLDGTGRSNPASNERVAPTTPQFSFRDIDGRDRSLDGDSSIWREQVARVETSNPVVQRAHDRAIVDLAALRLERVGNEWYPAAGVPWYNCLFGRDALITAIQCLPMGYPFPRAVLTRLAQLQGKRVNLWNDEEPGKIPHELRHSQFSVMGKSPFHPFYGTVDASLLYVILLSETYRFTGDRRLLEEFAGPLGGCLRWAERFGDIDSDGFIEYWMRTDHDFHNQGWKDATDAVVYPDGAIVPDPIAIVEVQGEYYDALRRAAEIYRLLGDSRNEDASQRKADTLYQAFNDQYWLPDEGYYAFGLGPDKRPIRSIASNPGQLLVTGIVPRERVSSVARRLMAPDLFCGWGIRTLSSLNGGYDPISYQRGSVWPCDNAIVALGLKRCGQWREANQIAEGIFTASDWFADSRLPELWAGLDSRIIPWPVFYPHANVPQAWSAGSVSMLLRAILGLDPDAANRRLTVRPTLPEWLDHLTVRGLAIAGERIDVRFRGSGMTSTFEVLGDSRGIVVESDGVV